MKKDKKRDLNKLGLDWFKPGRRGDMARALLAEHPEMFKRTTP